MFIFDGHLDLSMNAIHWNRDLSRPVPELRAREAGMSDKPDRGNSVVSLPDMQRGSIGICVATQIGHCVSTKSPVQGWASAEIAWAQTQAQLAWYQAMEKRGLLRQIFSRDDLNSSVRQWESATDAAKPPIGFILSLEGADSLIDLDHLQTAYDYGLRAIGPAHYGPGRYAPGTGYTGRMEQAGEELLAAMDQLNMVLDLTHLCDEAFWQALELYSGPVWASHNNCRAIIPGVRQFSDDQLKAIIEREGIVGAAFDAWMLYPDWIRGKMTPEGTGVSMEHVVNHIDHICQLAGNANHCCIGSDLDGSFGKEQCPKDMDTIADIRSIAGILKTRGYSDDDVNKIMYGNAIRFFQKNLP